ncbi:transcriptional regulator with XRE-family HTH domain [Aurantimicrobium minutum]|uniref:helix-turn-helix domain-containing protein n=1 Tax=Aurantimicrobium minutum TaxID=708131 RepID=UPI00247321A6|nr:helix-turn-helix transcriptional regulator [Aurantimicrobium minutum]MDH6277934.1 transcriptional regulator with XRE-family HTH domain [Aurantimicrobium minutum]
MLSPDQLFAEYPSDPALVEEHKKRMMAEVRAYRLKELRKELHITQVELAQQLQVSQNRISRIEHGDIEKSQVDTLRKYVEAVGGTLTLEVQVGDRKFQLA